MIEASSLKKGFGDRLLFDDLSFKLPRSGIVGIIGPNGAGKTTLFRMLVDEEKPDGGALKVGETVVVHVPHKVAPNPDPGAGVEFPIVYEDRWMLGVDKPAGLAVHPSGRRLEGTLIHALHRRNLQDGRGAMGVGTGQGAAGICEGV